MQVRCCASLPIADCVTHTCRTRRAVQLLLVAILGRPSLNACPPSCATNDLLVLLDTYCSDKGTFWQSKHHYGTAYHSIFGSIRESVTSILEVGIGEDTAPSVATWSTYFPNAHIYPVDIKTKKEVAERAKPNGATDHLVKHQAQFGCDVCPPAVPMPRTWARGSGSPQ